MNIKVTLTDENQPLNSNQVSDIEKELGVRFPEDYKVFLAHHNVSHVGPNNIEISAITTSVETFFGVSNSRLDDLLESNKTIYHGRLPKRIVAIAYAAGGNLICLHGETGEIYFWDHERECSDSESPSYENMTLLASTFGGFLELIKPREVPSDPSHSSYSWKSSDFNEKFKEYLKK